jgi:tRNA (cytidine/uridine-2'-O-)-methyltransferase
MIEIILYQPEIPQNTGNIGRLCAYTKCRLNLIHPLGFKINDKHLRRAGMDYWKDLNVIEHKSWEDFKNSPNRPKRIHLLSTHAKKSIWNANFTTGDGLLFGNEGHGAPDFVHNWVDQRISIPKFDNELRSLNLAVSAGIACYEALRQIQT